MTFGARVSGALRRCAPGLLVIPLLLVLLATRQGIALDWDAVVYLSAADSFADTGRLIDFRGKVLTTFAPGLPFVVGTLLKTGLSFNAIGIGLGVVALATTLFCTYRVARSVLDSAALAWLAVLLVGLAVSTVRVFGILKTEALFSALVMVTLALGLWAVQRQRTPPWWVLTLAVTVSAATTMRYIGFTLIPMGALAAFLAQRHRGTWPAVGLAVITGAATSAGLVLVSVRNMLLGVPPLGVRSPSGLTLADVATDTLGVWGSYLVPAQPAGRVQFWGGLLVLGLMLLAAVASYRLRSMTGFFLLVFMAGYLASLSYSEIATVIQPVNERLLAPVFPSLVILVMLGLAWACRMYADQPERHPRRWPVTLVRVLVLTSLASTLVVSAVTSTSFALENSHTGTGYNSIKSRTSPTALAVRTLPQAAGVAAVNGPRVYMATGRRPIFEIPWTNFFSRPEARQAKVRALRAQVRSGRVDYLVYFKSDSSNNVVTARQLRTTGLTLRKVGKFRDGEIWHASP